MERREAQRPTSLAARTPKAAIPGSGDIAVSALAGREVRPAGHVSLLYRGGDPPWRLPALHPLVGETEKGPVPAEAGKRRSRSVSKQPDGGALAKGANSE